MDCKNYAYFFTILVYLFILNSYATATVTNCSELKGAGMQKTCTEGSLYRCVDRPPDNVREFCFCQVGKKADYDSTTCVDINECSVAEIEDLCRDGYVEGFGYCGLNDACTQTPLDCERKSVPMCGETNTCTNYDGGYNCSCPQNSEHQPYNPGCQCKDFATCKKYGNLTTIGSNSVCNCSKGRYGLCCEFQYCLTTRDMYIDLNAEWPEQRSSETALLECSEIHPRFVGIATRKCSKKSTWEEADYSECLSQGIKNLKVELTQDDSNLVSLQNSLVQVVKENTSKLYPSEIIIVNKGLGTLVTNYIETQMEESPQDVANAAMKTPQVAIETASLLLNMANRESWELAEKENAFRNRTTVNALVDSLEQMSISLNQTKNENQKIEAIAENVALTYNFIDTTSPIEVQYPKIPINDTNHFKTEIRISQQILKQINNTCKGSFITSLHFPTVKSILPSARLEKKDSDYKEGSTSTLLMSDVLSINSKVCGNANLDTLLDSNPIQIEFSLQSLPKKGNSSSLSSLKCAFWNLTANTWSMQGVTTQVEQHSDETFKITCTTTHLTSFALTNSVCDCSKGRYGKCCEIQNCLTTRDMYIDLNVTWPEQRSSETALLECNQIHQRFVGIARRKCSENSTWEEADYSKCLSREIKNLKVELMQDDSNLVSLQNSLVQVVKENTSKLYPSEIIIVNKGLGTLVTNYIETQMEESPQDVANAAMKTPQVAIKTASLLLNMANRESWELAEKENAFRNRTTVNALVDSLEQMSISLNRTKNENQKIEAITDQNVALTYNFIETTSPIEIQYPKILINDTNHFKTEVFISQQILEQINNTCKGSFFTSLHFPTVKSIFPSARLEKKDSDYKKGSTLLVSDVLSLNSKVCGNANLNTFLDSNPIQIEFSLQSLPKKGNSSSLSSLKCAFWNLTANTWSMQGVTTQVEQHSNETFKITCTTTHLTSFALLLSSHEPKGVNNLIQRILSYIVCSVSVLALLASLTCYAILYIRTRKSNKNPFKNQDSIFIIHINLCMALLLGLLVFLFSSIASGDLTACTVIACIQHYLWLTVFSWSLCEGIAIAWKIKFWNKSQRIWPFILPFGWTLAIPVVVMTIVIVHIQHPISYVNPEVGCFLSNTNHLKLLSFVLPMLMILPTNFLFYIYTLYVIYRVKKRDETSIRVRSILISSLVLLPLLALPWIIGVFYVEENTVAFGYIFIIIIGLQGVFFFFIHVAKNEEVIEYVFKWKDPYEMKKFVKLNTLSSQSSKVSNALPTHPSYDEDEK